MKIVIYIFIAFLSFTTAGAKNIISKSYSVKWDQPVYTEHYNGNYKYTLSLSNDNVSFDDNYIPSLVHTFNINSATDSFNISIQPTDFSWPYPEEYQEYIDKVNNSKVNIKRRIVKNKGQLQLCISFVPLIRDTNDLSFKKIVNYTLNVEQIIRDSTFLPKQEFSGVDLKTYANSSALSTGTWHKVRLSETGVYKISYSQLKAWGFSSPEKVSVYGSGGDMLSEKNDSYRHDDLVQNSVLHANDALYFYAKGVVDWNYSDADEMFVHTKNDYSNYAYYFLTDNGSSKSISNSGLQPNTSTVSVSSYLDYSYMEENNINLLDIEWVGSGRRWFESSIEANGSNDYVFTFSNVLSSSNAKVKAWFAASSTQNSYFTLNYNGSRLAQSTLQAVSSNTQLSAYATDDSITSSFLPTGSNLTFNLAYDASTSSSLGFVDRISLNVWRKLTQDADQISFRNPNIIQSSQVAKYNVSDANNDLIIWDVDDNTNVLNVKYTMSNSTAVFNYDASTLHDFVSFNPNANLLSVDYVGMVNNQNLHSLRNIEYVVVTNEDFLSQAKEIAKFHASHDGLSTAVVTQQQVFNEFSSGTPDVCAIRDFMKMLYDEANNNGGVQPKYLLLFGDGSFDNISEENNTNKIITYQSPESFSSVKTYVSDDFFGFLDDGEGADLLSDKLDIGIGRFPVNTSEEADVVVQKSISYLTNQETSNWKTFMTFVADDGKEPSDIYNIHMSAANDICDDIESNYPQFNLKKIFFDAYTRTTTTSGYRYPDVEDAINESIESGTLVFNYTGHGSEDVLSGEYVVTKGSIESWNNIDKLTIFMTATCEFSRFDNKHDSSAGELVLLSSRGGGVVLFTTTRIVYSGENQRLNEAFYNHFFDKEEDGTNLAFGEILRRAKNDINTNSINRLNFSLLGDPALYPIYPQKSIIASSINGDQLSANDSVSVSAQEKVSVSGEVVNISNNSLTSNDTISLTDFNGVVSSIAYDKAVTTTTLGQIGNTPYSFDEFTNVMYRGNSSVNEGGFDFEFVIPTDIRYNEDLGKLSFYAVSDQGDEAFGVFDDLLVGGSYGVESADTVGPDINVYLNNRSFTSGQTISNNPLLILDLKDENGINISNQGIGHELLLIIDGNLLEQITLNNIYVSDLDDFTSGGLTYQIGELSEGEHKLKIVSWDNLNNSSEKEVSFFISPDATNINNARFNFYSNPVAPGGTSYFTFSHGEQDSNLQVQIEVYNLNGGLVNKINTQVESIGGSIPPIEWRATFENGRPLPVGIYIYKFSIITVSGQFFGINGKIIVSLF